MFCGTHIAWSRLLGTLASVPHDLPFHLFVRFHKLELFPERWLLVGSICMEIEVSTPPHLARDSTHVHWTREQTRNQDRMAHWVQGRAGMRFKRVLC